MGVADDCSELHRHGCGCGGVDLLSVWSPCRFRLPRWLPIPRYWSSGNDFRRRNVRCGNRPVTYLGTTPMTGRVRRFKTFPGGLHARGPNQAHL